MVEYRYALITNEAKVGYVSHPHPASREACMDRLARCCSKEEAPRLRCDYTVWLPTGLLPFPAMDGRFIDTFEFCPVWVDDQIVAVILRRTIEDAD